MIFWALIMIMKMVVRNIRSFSIVVAITVLYITSAVYQISEAVYFEALEQSRLEQQGVRWVIANRKDAQGHPEWSDTFYGVIRDGASRGNSRDFTYRYHHSHNYPEWAPILPYAHATRNGNWGKWFSINLDTALFLVGYYSGMGKDPTNGATFYKVARHKNRWFDEMVKSGKFCSNTVDLGAHIFYKLC